MIRHVARSSAVPWASRGYHASGTEIVRPSLRSTVSVSSVTTTFVAAGTAMSVSEEVIPSLQELFAMVPDDLFDPSDFSSSEEAAMRET